MDVDEEPSSYLNYLNDGDTPNTFFLGDNEVMLEPMFMDVTDWPTEGFSVMQSSPVVTENSTQSTQRTKKAPLILTEENCALVTTNNSEAVRQNNFVETCTIIAENGTEQTILVDKNFGVVAAKAQNPEISSFGDTGGRNIDSSQEHCNDNADGGATNNDQKMSTERIKSKNINKLENSENIAQEFNNFSQTNSENNIVNLGMLATNISEKSIKGSNNFAIVQQGLENVIGSFGVIANQNGSVVSRSLLKTAAVNQAQNSEYSNVNIDTTSRQNYCKETGGKEGIFQDFEEREQLGFQDFTPHMQESEEDFQNGESNFEDPDDPDPAYQNDEADLENAEEANYEYTEQVNFENADSQQLQATQIQLQITNLDFQNGDGEYEIHPDSTTYINYDPIVKEKENGLREIYLTEKDIFNDAKVIQLLNSDGSVITIDKALLNSIDVYRPHKSVLKPIQTLNNVPEKPPDIKDFYCSVTAKKCKICGFLAEKTDDVIAHILEHHSEQLGILPLEEHEEPAKKIHNRGKYSLDEQNSLEYVCKICKEVSFSSKELRNEHYKEVHPEDITVEEKAKQSLKEILENLIKQQQKALKKYKCTVQGCIASLPTEELRVRHLKMHVADRSNHFKCQECSEKFFVWRLARSHMLKKHQQDFGMLVCPMCSKFKTFSASTLRAHMNGHKEDDESFLCPICNKGFPSYNKMKNHKVYHHQPDDSNDVSGWPILQKCDLCETTFNCRKNLKVHIRDVHQNYRPYVCKICGHKTTRKAMLELHYRQHTGIKPYKCLYCEFRSADHNCLRRHLMTHVEATKQYTCPHCPYSCIQTVTLKSHIRVKHPNRPGVYRCKHCSYTSINMQSYRVHEKSHEFGKKGRLVNQTQVIDVAIRVPDREARTDTDEDTQNCFYEEQLEEEPIDTGGITIPAGFELPILDICEDTSSAIVG